MATSLQLIKGTDGVYETEIKVIVFCGHSNLITKIGEETPRCVQLLVNNGPSHASGYLTDKGIKILIAQLQSVLEGDYSKFKV